MLTTTTLFLIIVTLLFSSFVHGVVGFGFPLYATSIIAILIDIKLAIILTVIPNLLINAIYAIRGGFSEQIKEHWVMAVYVLVGTLFGSHALLYLNPDILKCILILMIVSYLLQEKFKKWQFLKKMSQHKIAMPVVGLFAGFLSGAVNVSSVPLVLYYLSLGLSPLALLQVLNLSFATGKLAQYVSLEIHGAFEGISWIILFILSFASIVGLGIGYYFHNRFSVEGYRSFVSKLLAVIALVLLLQVIWNYV